MTYDIALPSEVRRALLVEHARIARLLAELEDLADRVRMGDDTGGRFDTVAHQLRRMLVDHNQAEEAALEPLLRVVDSWGPVRVEEMLLEHRREHAELSMALTRPTGELADKIPRVAADLRAHMAREERSFLSSEVLRDDIVTSGPTS